MRISFYSCLSISMIVADAAKAFDAAHDDDYDYSLAQLEANDYGSSAAAEKDLQEWMLA
jgi:hypothetical protein